MASLVELDDGLSRRGLIVGAAAASLGMSLLAGEAEAATRSELNASASAALRRLYSHSDRARELSHRARAVLVFPQILKAGFVFGGQGGEGVLFIGGRPTAYFSIGAASFGFQAGAQTYGYALFFITKSALDYLRNSQGWAIGTGPSVVVLKEGAAKQADTTTLTQDVYAVSFNQRGLMGSLTLEGSKITRIHPKG